MSFHLRRTTTECTFSTSQLKKSSDPGVFCTFCLGLVLRATTACTCSTFQLPKVVRKLCVLCILISKYASCQNGVQLFISHLATWLRTRRFSEPTFRPSRATNHWKNAVVRDFPTFSRTWIFFLLTLSLLWSSLFCSSLLWLFPPSLFHLSILSEVWLPNFLRWNHIYLLLGFSLDLSILGRWAQSWLYKSSSGDPHNVGSWLVWGPPPP